MQVVHRSKPVTIFGTRHISNCFHKDRKMWLFEALGRFQPARAFMYNAPVLLEDLQSCNGFGSGLHSMLAGFTATSHNTCTANNGYVVAALQTMLGPYF